MLSFFKRKIFSRQSNDEIFFCNFLKKIGITPKNIDLYKIAVTHKSKSVDNNYERLEYLGDAILGLVVAEYLYEKYPSKKEGFLTDMRSKLVSRNNLKEVSKDLELSEVINSNLNDDIKENILGDVLEALIGAVYMDRGFEYSKEIIVDFIIEKYMDIDYLTNKIPSYKSFMIEWCQKHKKKYEFVTKEEVNSMSKKIYYSEFFIEGNKISKGRAESKRKSEVIASKRAYYAVIKDEK